MNHLAKTALRKIFNLDQKPSNNLPSSLLSPVTYASVVYSLKLGSLWGGIPFEFDQSQNRLLVTKRAVIKWKIITTLHLLNVSFFTGALADSILSCRISKGRSNCTKEEAKISMFNVAFTFIVSMLSICMLALDISIGSVHREEFSCLINRELKYLVYLKEKYTNKFGGKWRNGCEELMLAMRIMSTTFPAFAALHYAQHPDSPIYMTSYLPKIQPYYTLACLCNALFLFVLQVAGLSAIMGIFFPLVSFVFVLINLVQEIKAGRKVYRTKPSFRHPQALRTLIRTLQLLSNQVNEISRRVVVFEQSLVTCTGTVCLFCSIHFFDGLSLSGRGILVYTALSTVGVWTIVLTISAHVYTATEAGLNTWRNYSGWSRGEKNEMKKFRRSIRPIQQEFGDFYYIRPKKIMSFWNTLFWLIVRSLLTFPVHH